MGTGQAAGVARGAEPMDRPLSVASAATRAQEPSLLAGHDSLGLWSKTAPVTWPAPAAKRAPGPPMPTADPVYSGACRPQGLCRPSPQRRGSWPSLA